MSISILQLLKKNIIYSFTHELVLFIEITNYYALDYLII